MKEKQFFIVYMRTTLAAKAMPPVRVTQSIFFLSLCSYTPTLITFLIRPWINSRAVTNLKKAPLLVSIVFGQTHHYVYK